MFWSLKNNRYLCQNYPGFRTDVDLEVKGISYAYWEKEIGHPVGSQLQSKPDKALLFVSHKLWHSDLL